MKMLKFMFTGFIILFLIGCKKDDDNKSIEEPPQNLGPSEIKVDFDSGDITTIKITYTDFNKVAKMVFNRSGEIQTDVFTYNTRQKIASLAQTLPDGDTGISTYHYDASNKLINIEADGSIYPVTTTSTGFIISGGDFGNGEYFFNSEGQFTKFVNSSGGKVDLDIDPSIRGPFFGNKMDPILTTTYLLEFWIFPANGINSITNLFGYTNTKFTNTVNENNVLTAAFVKFEAADPSSPYQTITYKY